MNCCLKRLSLPQFFRIYKELGVQSGRPKYSQAQRDALAEGSVQQRAGGRQTKKPKHKDRQCNKIQMDVHHLPIDQAEWSKVPFPFEVPGKEDMHEGKEHE
jgi:hypothetical protein